MKIVKNKNFYFVKVKNKINQLLKQVKCERKKNHFNFLFVITLPHRKLTADANVNVYF